MSKIDGQTLWSAPDREGLARVLIEQFGYHEAPHHDRPNTTPTSGRTVLPKAHSLIDIYKLLHQGEFGLGHLIRDPHSFRDLLLQEFLRSGKSENEPLLETISVDGAGLRLNLRPFHLFFADDRDRALEALHEACLDSAARVKGRPERFLESLRAFQELNLAGRLKIGETIFVFPPREVVSFITEVEKYFLENNGVPVLSHSPAYRTLNRPSYRVVDLAAVKSSFPHMIPQ